MIKCLYLKHVAKILIFFDTPNDFPDNLTFILCFLFKHRCILILFAFSSLFSNKKSRPHPCALLSRTNKTYLCTRLCNIIGKSIKRY